MYELLVVSAGLVFLCRPHECCAGRKTRPAAVRFYADGLFALKYTDTESLVFKPKLESAYGNTTTAPEVINKAAQSQGQQTRAAIVPEA